MHSRAKQQVYLRCIRGARTNAKAIDLTRNGALKAGEDPNIVCAVAEDVSVDSASVHVARIIEVAGEIILFVVEILRRHCQLCSEQKQKDQEWGWALPRM